jgi:hypothetical protein
MRRLLAHLVASQLRSLARRHAGSATSLVVLAIAAKAILGRVGTFDLGFDDECYILDAGLGLPTRPLPPADYGPLYAVWYRVIGALEPDPVGLYTFNWVVLQLGLAALLYALSRRSGAPRLAAGLVTIVWSLSHAVMAWPFTVYFSTAILALGALAATFTKDGLVAVTMLAIATATASFARPELAIPGMPLAATAIVWSLARALRSRCSRALGAAIAVAATIAVLVRIFGSPLGGGRSYFAFEQHYALNRVEAEGLDVDPWTAYQPITTAAFPHARSIGEAAREDPLAFAWHVERNARLLPDKLAWFWDVTGYVPRALKIALAWGAGAVLIAGAFALTRRRRRLSPRLLAWLPIWIPVGASFAAAVLLIRPRDHYLVPFGFFANATLAAACGALARLPSRRAPFVSLSGLVAALALFALLPTYRRGALPSLVEARGDPPPEDWDGRNTVEALRALGLRGERVILAPEFSHAVYARIPFRWIPQNGKDRPFSDFLRQHDVDVVIASPRLRDDARFRDDPEFRSFLEDDGDHRGFVLTRVPRSSTTIAVRPK